MTHSISSLQRILIEDGSLNCFTPVVDVHRVLTYELELAETVVAIVGAGGRVDYVGSVWVVRVGELLGAFVGGETVVGGPPVGGSLPREGGHGEDDALGEGGRDGPGVEY